MANELRIHQNFLGGRLLYAVPAASTVITDGVSNSTTTITSATAAFTAADVGATITGTDLPAAVYIASVTNATTAVLSAAATGTGSARTWTINRHQVLHSAALAAMSVVGTTNHMMGSLDEDGLAGEPEVFMVTKHDSAATWAQVSRAQEGTTARAHVAGMDWVHAPLATDVRYSAYACRVYRSAALSENNNDGATPISYDAEEFDPYGMHDLSTNPERVTLNKIGIWEVSWAVSYSDNATGIRDAALYKNNVLAVARTGIALTGSSTMIGTSDLVRAAAVTDYLTVKPYQNSGGTLALSVGTAYTFLSAVYLGA